MQTRFTSRAVNFATDTVQEKNLTYVMRGAHGRCCVYVTKKWKMMTTSAGNNLIVY